MARCGWRRRGQPWRHRAGSTARSCPAPTFQPLTLALTTATWPAEAPAAAVGAAQRLGRDRRGSRTEFQAAALSGVSGVKCQRQRRGFGVPPSTAAQPHANANARKAALALKQLFARGRRARAARGARWRRRTLTSTTLQRAASTSLRLKQWDEERRRCALFWL